MSKQKLIHLTKAIKDIFHQEFTFL